MNDVRAVISAAIFTILLLSSCGDSSQNNLDPKEVAIGTQIWITKNLNVDTFRNGDIIPEVKDSLEWIKAGKNSQPAWCYYDNDSTIGEKYGKLYNWYAVNDPRGLAPAGWHIPTDIEFEKLTYQLGGAYTAINKMKSTSEWYQNGNGTNSCGFSGLPGGCRGKDGKFTSFGKGGTWWSSTMNKAGSVWYRSIGYVIGYLYRNYAYKGEGMSVRCIKD